MTVDPRQIQTVWLQAKTDKNQKKIAKRISGYLQCIQANEMPKHPVRKKKEKKDKLTN